MRDASISAEALGKTYPDGTEALRDISLHVAPGECYGLVGADGAGKSTLAGVLSALVRPTAGRAIVAGFDVVAAPRAVRRVIGSEMQDADLDPCATAGELLLAQGRRHGLSRAESTPLMQELLELLALDDVTGMRLTQLSDGTRRCVELAATLIHWPSVVLLDEPTEGLDPRARIVVWDMLERLRRRLGPTLVLTTRHMDEADRLCDRIDVIERGRIVAEGIPARLQAMAA